LGVFIDVAGFAGFGDLFCAVSRLQKRMLFEK
jgi:hypothetical protein